MTTTAQPTRREVLTRVAPRDELVNVLEFEAEAARLLAADTARLLTGSDRAAFDRVTFRPRMMVNCVELSLALDLFGQRLFAPIIIGPVSDQQRFHAEGELATLNGAAAGKAAVVVSRRSSLPLEAIASAAKTPWLFQVSAADAAAENREAVARAGRAGACAVVLTVGEPTGRAGPSSALNLTQVDSLCASVALPIVVKGVTTAAEAQAAVKRGAGGVVVSTYGRGDAPSGAASLDRIRAVVDGIGADIPVLVDGGFRRGTDVMKALALGARAVLVARPAMWGLAAYGADGVQTVVELLQTELARVMACCGAPTLSAISGSMVKVHARTMAASSR